MKIGLSLAVFEEMYDAWATMWQPGGIGYLASYLRTNAPEIEVIIDRSIDALIDARPDIIGLSSVTYCYGFAQKNAERIKDALGIPVIIGGPHITVVPLALAEIFDAGVVGEGEQTLLELLRLFEATGRLDACDLRRIPGLVFREDRKLSLSPRREPIESLDHIPMRARDLLHQWGNLDRQANLFASRGCPFTCSYCSTVQVWGRNVRRHSPTYVVNEIEFLANAFGTSKFLFNDDLFALNARWVESIGLELRSRGLEGHLEFRCCARANTMTPKMMEALASMNVRLIDIGLESGSSAMLEKLGKTACSVETNERAMQMLREFGIKGDSCFIFGTPGETRQDILDTFSFVCSNYDVLDDVLFCPLIPFPGTESFEWAREKFQFTETHLPGLVMEVEDLLDWDAWMRTKYPFMNSENMSLEELINYIKIGRSMTRTMPGYTGETNIDPKLGRYGRPNAQAHERRSGTGSVARGRSSSEMDQTDASFPAGDH